MGVIWNAFLDMIFGAMQLVYSFVGDWGISIVVITILFRLLVWPLMVKQVRSTREMQKLQPYIAEIRKKYPDDKEKQGQEQMALYKEHGVNPFGGCLPLLLQMPLMIGFFAVIMVPPTDDKGIVQSTMYGLGRLPEYLGYVIGEPLADLSIRKAGFLNILPDITLTPSSAWDIGVSTATPYIILLVLSSVAILLPTIMNQKNMVGPQAQQQKMIGYAMAVMMGFIGWSLFSGGVLLYLSTSSLFAAGQQFIVQRQADKEDAAEEAALEEAKRKKKAERKKGTKNKNATKKNTTKGQ